MKPSIPNLLYEFEPEELEGPTFISYVNLALKTVDDAFLEDIKALKLTKKSYSAMPPPYLDTEKLRKYSRKRIDPKSTKKVSIHRIRLGMYAYLVNKGIKLNARELYLVLGPIPVLKENYRKAELLELIEKNKLFAAVPKDIMRKFVANDPSFLKEIEAKSPDEKLSLFEKTNLSYIEL